jgi:N-formylmaleamate deformylase
MTRLLDCSAATASASGNKNRRASLLSTVTFFLQRVLGERGTMTHTHLFPKLTAVLIAITAVTLTANPPTPKAFDVKITGAGQPVILIPGLESSGDVWTDVTRHLQTHYQVHVLTLAGFAGQPAIPGLRLVDVKNEIVAYIRDRHLAHPVIAGHSLGGFLALWIAASAPDLPDRVISVDGVPFLPALMNLDAKLEASSTGDAEKMKDIYAGMKADQLAATSKMALSYMISDPKNIELATEWARRSDPAFVGQAVYDLMTTDLRDDLKNVGVPVLLIGAAKSSAGDKARLDRTRAAYESQVSLIPDHKVEMDTDALHFIMFDDPHFLIGAIDRFLSKEDCRDAR